MSYKANTITKLTPPVYGRKQIAVNVEAPVYDQVRQLTVALGCNLSHFLKIIINSVLENEAEIAAAVKTKESPALKVTVEVVENETV